MKIIVSGLINIETTVKVRNFPIPYYPIDYPFFGIASDVSGVAFNLAKAFKSLGDETQLVSFIGKDEEGSRILKRLADEDISLQMLRQELAETPASVVLYDEEGKRQIYCDLKDIQEKRLETENGTFTEALEKCDMVAACNVNFNRSLLKAAKKMGKRIATDVHVLEDTEDAFNKEFMENADILFLSDEKLPCGPEEFLRKLKERYPAQVVVIGMGAKGALLYDRSEEKVYCLEAVRCEKVVNTVGAGDALFAGFLHFYGKGYRAVEALERAEIFAAEKIMHNGAARGFCTEQEVEEAYQSRKPKIKERFL